MLMRRGSVASLGVIGQKRTDIGTSRRHNGHTRAAIALTTAARSRTCRRRHRRPRPSEGRTPARVASPAERLPTRRLFWRSPGDPGWNATVAHGRRSRSQRRGSSPDAVTHGAAGRGAAVCGTVTGRAGWEHTSAAHYCRGLTDRERINRHAMICCGLVCLCELWSAIVTVEKRLV